MKVTPKDTPEKAEWPMRINKYLAHEKHSTRRGADELIKKGLVLINGKKAVLGDKVTQSDTVLVRFRTGAPKLEYYAYHKPRGIVTHSAQRGATEIKHVLPIKNVFPIGRLDRDSHGLIILTNDGRITKGLLDPSENHDKEYLVTTKNKLRSSFKGKMEAGVQIENEHTLPAKVTLIDDYTFRVILTEGKRHQIRRMCSALFQDVDDLERTRIMNIELGKLLPGSYRKIEGEELKTLLHSLDLA